MLDRNWFARLASMTLGAAFVATPVIAADVATTDWPEFHGPKRDNISLDTGLLKEWPKGGPTKLWQIKGIGGGYSSVSVVNGKIYTAGDDKESGSSYVFALNQADGSQIWKAKLGKTGGAYEGTRATPTVDGDTIYMMGQFGDLVAYRAADGSELWRKNLNTDLGGKMMSHWGNSESPVVEGDKILCTPGGKQGTLAAINKKTGEVIWRSKGFGDQAAYMAPVVAEVGGVRQAITMTDQSVAGVAVEDGRLLWQVARRGDTAVIPTPVVKVEDAKTAYVYVTSGYKIGCDLFKITAADGKFTPTAVYTKNGSMVNHHGGVILIEGHVYGYSDAPKGWVCQELMTGQVKWRDKELLGKGTITYADGRFYLRDEGSGDIVLLEASPTAHQERGRFTQPERTKQNAWPHLVISNGKLFVRDQGNLFCYDIKAK